MNKSVKLVLIGVLLIVFIISGIMVIKTLNNYDDGSDIYDNAEELSGLSEGIKVYSEEELLLNITEEELKNIDLSALKEVNEDVMGWIVLPGTSVSYPLMDGDDNQYYLDHTWDKNSNSVGSIFLEEKCSSDLDDFNTIIYGHNMKDKSMFGSLKLYKDEDFWKSAPYVYLVTEEGVLRYDVFETFEADVEWHVFWIDIQEDATKQKFIDLSMESSQIDTGIIPEVSDQILTLSTCTGGGYEKRRVVQAVLVGTTLNE